MRHSLADLEKWRPRGQYCVWIAFDDPTLKGAAAPWDKVNEA